MNVIFLDVDGVLNSADWMKTKQREIDSSKVRRLKQIIDATGAKIVLSSTWRNVDGSDGNPRHPMYDYLVDELRSCGIEIFSRTPLLYNDRPKEIKAWLDQISMNVEHYISLDDDFQETDYGKYGLSNCLIQTRYWGTHGGVQQEHVERAIRLLMNRKDGNYGKETGCGK